MVGVRVTNEMKKKHDQASDLADGALPGMLRKAIMQTVDRVLRKHSI